MNFLNREIVDFFAMWDMIDFFFLLIFTLYIYILSLKEINNGEQIWCCLSTHNI